MSEGVPILAGAVWIETGSGNRCVVNGVRPLDEVGDLGSTCMVHASREGREPHLFDWWCEAAFRRAFEPSTCEQCGGRGTVGPCPLSLSCRACRARPGVFCKRPSGHPAHELHVIRVADAEGADEPA